MTDAELLDLAVTRAFLVVAMSGMARHDHEYQRFRRKRAEAVRELKRIKAQRERQQT